MRKQPKFLQCGQLAELAPYHEVNHFLKRKQYFFLLQKSPLTESRAMCDCVRRDRGCFVNKW